MHRHAHTQTPSTRIICLFCLGGGLFCLGGGLFCNSVGFFCLGVGLFCLGVGLFCLNVGLFCSTIRPTQSIVYVPLPLNRFQKSILLIVPYTYLISCSGDFILQNLILRTRSCSTGFITQSCWVLYFRLTPMVRSKYFVPQWYQLRRGISEGPALKYFYMNHRGGRTREDVLTRRTHIKHLNMGLFCLDVGLFCSTTRADALMAHTAEIRQTQIRQLQTQMQTDEISWCDSFAKEPYNWWFFCGQWPAT